MPLHSSCIILTMEYGSVFFPKDILFIVLSFFVPLFFSLLCSYRVRTLRVVQMHLSVLAVMLKSHNCHGGVEYPAIIQSLHVTPMIVDFTLRFVL